MLQNKWCNQSVLSPWTHLAFIHLQVDDNQGLLLKSENEESLSPPFKFSLKRQTATAHLTGPCQASIRQKKANQAKHVGAEQVEEVKGATLSSQTSLQTNGYHHQPCTQTQLPPQPYSNVQTHPNKSPTIPSNPSIDHPKVCCIIYIQHLYCASVLM